MVWTRLGALPVTTAEAFQVVYQVGHLKGQEAFVAALSAAQPPGIYSNFDFLYWLNSIHIAIVVGLIIATIGLWCRKTAGFLLSMVALLWVALVYIWWYRDTSHFLRNVEATEYTRLHDPFFKEMGVLRGASSWDVLVLLVAVVLLLWQLRKLVGALRSQTAILPEHEPLVVQNLS